jgi:hypothetical protein
MKAILMFTGFQESEAKRSGFEAGYFDIVRHFASEQVTTYHPRTWKTDIDNLLRQLFENGIREVAILCYSHGQSAAMDFGQKAGHYGIKIPLLLTCDAVYRPSWAPRSMLAQILAVRAMIGNPKIKVPPSIREVFSVIQKIEKPCGHPLVAEDTKATLIYNPEVLTYGHTRMDEAPEWWQLVSEKLKRFTHRNS